MWLLLVSRYSVMDQPLFSCTKCHRNFAQSEMSRSGQTCKGCNPHHSTFKQCEYCKSDFKYYVFGDICPRCQSLKSKYGEPQPCSICKLRTAFGSALVCQRCLHYRNRFGEPRQCHSCGNMCAFLKDEASRVKVDGQILCWVCTYNFKLARSREKSTHGSTKRRHDNNQFSDTSHSKSLHDSLKRACTDEYGSRKCETQINSQQALTTQMLSLDTVYNEHLLTISQLQDEIKSLKRQLTLKDADLLAKDRLIAELRSEMIDMKNVHEDRIHKVKSAGQLEQDRLLVTIRQLQKEKVTLSQGLKRRKCNTSLVGLSNHRHSISSSTLFNPDSPLVVSSSAKQPTTTTKTPVGNQIGESGGDKRTPSKFSKSSKDSTPDSINRSVEKRLLIDSNSVQASDEDSNLTPKRTDSESIKRKHTSSPDLTPSASSEPLTEDEEEAGSQSYQFNPQEMIDKDPLGLDTPTESDDEAAE